MEQSNYAAWNSCCVGVFFPVRNLNIDVGECYQLFCGLHYRELAEEEL